MFNKFKNSVLFRILVVALVIGLSQVFYTVYLVATSPAVIRKPQMEHYHFRMQILVDGKAENFADEQYQAEYIKDQCTDDLTDRPIHFHDEKDQIVHIHWEGMTGGLVLKNYGWNLIGGPDGSLGYRLEKFWQPENVLIHSRSLPTVSRQVKYLVYIGDENAYKQKSFEEWKQKDLEEFFGVTSNFPAHKINKGEQSWLRNKLLPKASAHGVIKDEHSNDSAETDKEKLARINNLIGNVVIFAQKEAPTDQQIKDRFNDLEPLTESTCGG